jgi:hypothetical protein
MSSDRAADSLALAHEMLERMLPSMAHSQTLAGLAWGYVTNAGEKYETAATYRGLSSIGSRLEVMITELEQYLPKLEADELAERGRTT